MKTILFDEHVSLGARMVPFAGWEMPLLYRGIVPEHLWTREHASVFDICHMGEFEIKGATAERDLEKLLTMSVAALKPGRCAYGYLLAEDGGVLDDLICFRFGPERFMLVVNAGTLAGDRDWIRAHLSPQTVFVDLSPVTAKLDIQGPRSRELLEKVFSAPLPELGFFRFQELELLGSACLLSRTGYTGEWGYELFVPVAVAQKFWQEILRSGEIKPAGLGARDTLRVEMGYPLYGHELRREWTPAGAAHGRFLELNKHFIGCEAVQRALHTGAARELAGLILEGRMAGRAGDVVLQEDAVVGELTSGLFAPSLNTAVALAYIERDCCVPGKVVSVLTRGRKLPARIEPLPLYKQGSARSAVAKK